MGRQIPRTIPELAYTALNVQNGSNFSGMLRGFEESMRDLEQNLQFSNMGRNRHPITLLWISKLHDFCGLGMSDSEAYEKALKECQELAKSVE